MPINIQDKELMLYKNGIKESENIWIEQDIVVPDSKPDVMQIISTHVTPYVLNMEVSDGRVNVTGKLNYFIIYNTGDAKYGTRGIFVSHPFTQSLAVKGLKKDMNVIIKPVVKNVISSLPNERKISVKSEIMFKISVKDFTRVKLINDFSSEKAIEKRVVSDKFSNVVSNKTSIVASREDILLSKDAEDLFEILRIESEIKNTEIKESFNKIMLKGDIVLKLVYLTESDDTIVKNTSFVIPFTGMIEFDNINDRTKFDVDYIMQDLEIEKNMDITTTKALSVEYRILADVTQYEEDEISYVEDFYSQYEELDYNKREENVIKQMRKESYTVDVSESTSGAFDMQKLVDYSVDLNGISVSESIGGFKLSGNVKINMLMQNNDSRQIESKNVEILIDKEIKKEEDRGNEKNDILISLDKSNVVQNENNLDISISLRVDVEAKNEGNIQVIDELNTKKINSENLDSMNIYIVKENDDLWNIAKKYKTSIENIQKINEELRDDNLSVGQKILIIR